jgi:hypothetical protein
MDLIDGPNKAARRRCGGEQPGVGIQLTVTVTLVLAALTPLAVAVMVTT